MLAGILFVAGLVAIAVATGALAGLWWGVLAGGALLVTLAVLTDLGDRQTARNKPGVPR